MKYNMTKAILESVQEVNDDTKSLTSRALHEADVLDKQLGSKSCPRCGKRILGYPAISRFDNKTEICSDCGTEEAIENMMGYITNPLTKETFATEEFKQMKTKDSEELDEEVTVDTDVPTSDDLEKDDEEIKNKSKEEKEKRIGELRISLEDNQMSDDEKKAIEQEIAEIEDEMLSESCDKEEK